MSASPVTKTIARSEKKAAADHRQSPRQTRPVSETETSDSGASSKFRVVSHAGNRYAFKLENIFWQILQLAADAKKKRIGAYVAEVLRSSKTTENKTSTLRTHAADWICRQLYESTSKMISPRMLGKLVSASPVPALAMDNKDRIIAQNAPFLELIRNLAKDGDIAELGTIRVKLQRDINEIRSSPAGIAGPYLDEKINIKSNLGEWCFDSRIVNIQSTQGTSIGLLLFITN